MQEEILRGELRQIRISKVGRLPVPNYLRYRKGKDFSPMQRVLLDAVRVGMA